MPDRTILHIDMDCFYAAVEVRDNPSLRGKPVIVGADPGGRGVVSACNYEARAFGVHSAQPISRAKRLCPHGIFLPVSMPKYMAVSKSVMETLRGFTDLVEQISVDEAFLDVTKSRALFGTGLTIARKIKASVRRVVDLSCSLGVAPCKFAAKVASDLGKPDGLLVVPPGRVAEFLDPLPVSRLWGVGKKTEPHLSALGLYTMGDVRRAEKTLLTRAVGATLAGRLLALSRGDDPRPVSPFHEAKSISAEHTYQSDTNDREKLRRTLLHLTRKVVLRLRREGRLCRTVALHFRTEDFNRYSRQSMLLSAADTLDPVRRAVEKLFDAEHFSGKKLRLIGVSLSGFSAENPEAPPQLSLFSKPRPRAGLGVDAIEDAVMKKFGARAITRARLLE